MPVFSSKSLWRAPVEASATNANDGWLPSKWLLPFPSLLWLVITLGDPLTHPGSLITVPLLTFTIHWWFEWRPTRVTPISSQVPSGNLLHSYWQVPFSSLICVWKMDDFHYCYQRGSFIVPRSMDLCARLRMFDIDGAWARGRKQSWGFSKWRTSLLRRKLK